MLSLPVICIVQRLSCSGSNQPTHPSVLMSASVGGNAVPSMASAWPFRFTVPANPPPSVASQSMLTVPVPYTVASRGDGA